MSSDRDFACTRCNARPCSCIDPGAADPAYRTLEHERPGFEQFMREHYADRPLTRYGHTYVDSKVRDRWIGWQARARTVPYLLAKRA